LASSPRTSSRRPRSERLQRNANATPNAGRPPPQIREPAPSIRPRRSPNGFPWTSKFLDAPGGSRWDPP
jgi:hypothetical protein